MFKQHVQPRPQPESLCKTCESALVEPIPKRRSAWPADEIEAVFAASSSGKQTVEV